MEQMDDTIKFRLSRTQRAELEAAAAASKLKLSQWVRAELLKAAEKVRDGGAAE